LPLGDDIQAESTARQVQAALYTAVCSAPDSTCLRVLAYAVIDLPPVNRYLAWRLYAQLDLTSSNAHNCDLDVITDHYSLT